MEEKLYTISELAGLAGVTPRTIRYYTAEGLLPRPDARGQYALYSEEHLLRLQLIARLKAAYLPLGEIKAQLEHLSVERIRQLLEEYRDVPEPEPASSATDYLAQVLARQQAALPTDRALKESRASFSVPKMQAFSGQAAPAEEAPTHPPAAPPQYGFAVPAAAPSPPEPPAAPQQDGLLSKLIPQRRARAEADQAAAPAAIPPSARDVGALPRENWRRFQLAPGVELHLREPIAAALQERVEALLAFARNLFRD